MSNPVVLVALGGLSILLSWAGVRFTRRYAMQRLQSGSSVYYAEVPRGGGLAILVVVLLIFMPVGFGISDPGQVVRFALAGSMIAVIGFFDDLRTLPRPIRVLAQCLAALIFVPAAPISYLDLPRLNIRLDLITSYAVSVIWVVGLVNVFSYMDGINGLAGGQAVLAGCLWAAVGLLADKPLIALLGLLVAGATLGFLVYNLPPNSIFLGDVGSSFLGFSLAALPMLIVAQGESPRLIISGGMMVSLFVFDAALTFFRYLMTRRWLPHTERSHLYQRMIQLGDPPLRVLMLYLTLSTGFGLAGLIYWREAAAAALAFVVMVCVTLYAWVTRRETTSSTGIHESQPAEVTSDGKAT